MPSPSNGVTNLYTFIVVAVKIRIKVNYFKSFDTNIFNKVDIYMIHDTEMTNKVFSYI